MERVRAVALYLYPRPRRGLGVGIPADVVAALDDEHAQAQLTGASLGDGQAEKAGPDDSKVDVHWPTGGWLAGNSLAGHGGSGRDPAAEADISGYSHSSRDSPPPAFPAASAPTSLST